MEQTVEARAPVQGEGSRPGEDGYKPPGTIAWSEHLEAYAVYAQRFGRNQSAERIAERGGFGYCELLVFLGHDPKTWERA